MRKRFTNRLHAGLSCSGVALVRRSGWIRQEFAVLADQRANNNAAMSITQAAAELKHALTNTDCSAMPVTIVLADEWVRLFMVTPPHNSTRLSDCEAAAAMRFQALYGEPSADWQIDADWRARASFLACAIPKALPLALHQVADELHLTVIAIVPQFVAAWNRWCTDLHDSTWFGIVCDDMLTLGALNGRHLFAIRAAAIPDDAAQDAGWLSAHLAREALRLNLPMPSEIRLCGNPPECWTAPAGDTLRRTRLAMPTAAIETMSTEMMLALMGVSQ